MVVDAVIWHWVTLVNRRRRDLRVSDGRSSGLWISSMHMMESLPPPRPYDLQADLEVLMGIFDWIYLQMNVTKRLGMTYQPC